MRRWIFLVAALLAAGVLFASLYDRTSAPSEEIDDTSKEALREILRQEDQ